MQKSKVTRISYEFDNELTRYASDVNKSKLEASREIARLVRGVRGIKSND